MACGRSLQRDWSGARLLARGGALHGPGARGLSTVPPFAANLFVPDEPPLWPQDTAAGWCPFCYPFNLSAQPALSIPCANTADGLPIGCQLVAPAWQDALLLQVGQQIESLLSEAPLQAPAKATQSPPGISMS